MSFSSRFTVPLTPWSAPSTCETPMWRMRNSTPECAGSIFQVEVWAEAAVAVRPAGEEQGGGTKERRHKALPRSSADLVCVPRCGLAARQRGMSDYGAWMTGSLTGLQNCMLSHVLFLCRRKRRLSVE